jgi:cyclopropane fatty-acyl-phospholipid synthase-like methyltransferase
MRALAGDYKKGELPRPFDAVLLSHIIHGMGEKGNRRLLNKVYRCLEPGGILILRDFLLNEGKTSPANAAVFAVNMLVNTENGRTYTFGEVRRWLSDAGFHKIKCVSRPSASGKDNASVMTALKPGS